MRYYIRHYIRRFNCYYSKLANSYAQLLNGKKQRFRINTIRSVADRMSTTSKGHCMAQVVFFHQLKFVIKDEKKQVREREREEREVK